MNTPSAKDEILGRIRSASHPGHELPDIPAWEFRYDPVGHFIDRLQSFDGKIEKFRTRTDAVSRLMELADMNGDNVIFSTVADVAGNFGEKDLADLHNASRINTFVTESPLGVGEMGSVWVTDAILHHPACALLSRYLYVLLDRNAIVGSLHEAYARLRLRDNAYGSFFTGPSATADIEAVHITGAQGPLALTVMLYNCPDA